MIASPQNPRVKYVARLMHKRKFREHEGRFAAEGRRELLRALAGGICPELVLVCDEIAPATEIIEAVNRQCPRAEIERVGAKVYERLAYRGGTEGVIFTAPQADHRPQWEKLPARPLLLLAEGIQKPGNLGAILRTTDAVGADACVFVNPQTDLYNPNVIRASLGTLFDQRVWLCDTAGLARAKARHHWTLYAATLQNSRIYWREDFRGGSILAVGSEAQGLSEEIRRLADRHIYIPMHGIADSLNVSVSAAVLLYEALRQRSGG